MSDEIVNRVAKSALVTIDLEDNYPQGQRTLMDIKSWLFQELILKETDFRAHVQQHNWSAYTNHYVALTCTADAIIPSWAYMLITAHLAPYAKKIVVGSLQDLETAIFQDLITELDYTQFENKPVIVKGCSNKPIPKTAYVQLVQKLQPVARSIMFGEACSTVPLYKKKA